MSLSQILEAIRKLEMDAEARASAKTLDREVTHFVRDHGNEMEKASLMTKAKRLEAKFAKKYPVAAHLISELIEAIGGIGS